ncbi:acyl-CoA thioesterase [Nakamurella leprariae]|uniref:Acyl-CoA thioesterase n=1 Tax=Nakamurella leprariae TaxID=2803911 RepID=A0A939C017_9ACTN|nr:thioesterase family protein [Nakamurella leprariae]MBM9465717.1 acyl-CoA thioesterase [Nakamurella leprariae]
MSEAVLEFSLSIPVEVRFADHDVFGHVNHVHFVRYCEQHRIHFMSLWRDECGVDVLDRGFVVARVECDYLRPIGYGTASVDVEMCVERIGRTSFTLRYNVLSNGAVSASLRAVIVLTDSEGRPRPVGDSERRFLRRHGASEDSSKSS